MILKSLEGLSKRMDSIESQTRRNASQIPDTNDDALSIMADISALDSGGESVTTVKSSGTPVRPLEASVEPIKAPVEPTKASVESESSKTPGVAATASNDHGLFDPLATLTSGVPSSFFSKLLDTNFRRKLSY